MKELVMNADKLRTQNITAAGVFCFLLYEEVNENQATKSCLM
jgi:hypothetical protein